MVQILTLKRAVAKFNTFKNEKQQMASMLVYWPLGTVLQQKNKEDQFPKINIQEGGLPPFWPFLNHYLTEISTDFDELWYTVTDSVLAILGVDDLAATRHLDGQNIIMASWLNGLGYTPVVIPTSHRIRPLVFCCSRHITEVMQKYC